MVLRSKTSSPVYDGPRGQTRWSQQSAAVSAPTKAQSSRRDCTGLKDKVKTAQLSPPQGGLANTTASAARLRNRVRITSKQSPWIQTILAATPYSSALCFAHLSTDGSFSMAKTRSQRPDRAKAMLLPPAPAKASMRRVLEGGAPWDMCLAIVLRGGLEGGCFR